MACGINFKMNIQLSTNNWSKGNAVHFCTFFPKAMKKSRNAAANSGHFRPRYQRHWTPFRGGRRKTIDPECTPMQYMDGDEIVPWTLRLVVMNCGGWELAWHLYVPLSETVTLTIFRVQSWKFKIHDIYVPGTRLAGKGTMCGNRGGKWTLALHNSSLAPSERWKMTRMRKRMRPTPCPHNFFARYKS